jgi:mono/diheme cytochrome c family protein/glucose/arabinose dehydrogenase
MNSQWAMWGALCAFGLGVPNASAAEGIPPERPRARPPSELTGWAEWEKAAEIFSQVKVPPAPPFSPEAAMKTFKAAPGFRVELVAAEPMIAHPIFFEFDPDGRIWVVEYRGYMRDLDGRGEADPICRVVVLEDTNEDGRADKSTVFLDRLVMPRTLAFVQGGVLVAEPPHLWYCADTNADLRADTKELAGSYGRAGNPQHTANGLAYGIDNWLHNADWQRKHRFRAGKLIEEPVLYRGQFGVSFDEVGRYVTCRESSPAEMDLIPEEYVRRNAALVKSWERGRDRARFGVAVPIGREANECFPIRPTPGITLGALELRLDGTLRTYTIVAGTGVYLGDQFPDDAYGNIFVPEAGGHLIGRLRLSGGISPRAQRYYPAGQEILASTNERFRPMSIRTGPDGALYFADMYKGIIEHVIFMAPYIADQIKERNLAAGNDMGRIYRLVSTDKPITRARPRLSTASSAELVEHLTHPNGWWRITAQRLLVERNDPAIVPRLRAMVVAGAGRFIGRLHALWTLDGMKALDVATTLAAASDANEQVRAAAIRLMPEPRALLGLAQKAMKDPSEAVRLQAALSLGGLPGAAADAELLHLLTANTAPLFRTAVLSGLHGREEHFLERLLQSGDWRAASDDRRAFLREFAEMLFDGRDPRLITMLFEKRDTQEDEIEWRRQALLDGLLAAAPSDSSGFKRISLEREPRVVLAMVKSSERGVREKGRRLSELFTWPGAFDNKASAPLSPEHQQLFTAGRELFTQLCAPCHQPHGGGLANVAPPVNGSEWVAGPPERLVRVVLHGLFGPLEVGGTRWNHHMPGFKDVGLIDDRAVAAVLTYVRRAWDNAADPVEPALVAKVRAATVDRHLPWTVEELLGVAPSGREPEVIRPNAAGELILPAKLAVCFGERLGYRPALDILGPWRKENDVATWRVEAPAEAVYEVSITLAADAASKGDQFLIESELGRVAGAVPATGGYDNFQELRVGELKLRAGINRILLRPEGKLRAELADIRGLRLARGPQQACP